MEPTESAVAVPVTDSEEFVPDRQVEKFDFTDILPAETHNQSDTDTSNSLADTVMISDSDNEAVDRKRETLDKVEQKQIIKKKRYRHRKTHPITCYNPARARISLDADLISAVMNINATSEVVLLSVQIIRCADMASLSVEAVMNKYFEDVFRQYATSIGISADRKDVIKIQCMEYIGSKFLKD